MKASGFLVAAAVLAVPAMAETPAGDWLRAADRARLGDYHRAVGEALETVLARAEGNDLATVLDTFQGAALSGSEAVALLPGDWDCRMIKLGAEGLPVVAYAPFKCRVDADLNLTKLSGSQLLRGSIRADETQDRLVFAGVGYVSDATPPSYHDLPDELGETGSVWPSVGLVSVVSGERARIVMPYPYNESVLDVLLLTR
ncbi:MAG: DUF4893 domain-containing protein [Paracoccus sp. (in: a-proteobacteria)]|nr:DUF4893 domain-containing protein [Paracoccus sp. (in: a-proteobacteria)]